MDHHSYPCALNFHLHICIFLFFKSLYHTTTLDFKRTHHNKKVYCWILHAQLMPLVIPFQLYVKQNLKVISRHGKYIFFNVSWSMNLLIYFEMSCSLGGVSFFCTMDRINEQSNHMAPLLLHTLLTCWHTSNIPWHLWKKNSSNSITDTNMLMCSLNRKHFECQRS